MHLHMIWTLVLCFLLYVRFAVLLAKDVYCCRHLNIVTSRLNTVWIRFFLYDHIQACMLALHFEMMITRDMPPHDIDIPW
jgi:hypothetical protein